MSHYVLFATSACHLCELAEEQLLAATAAGFDCGYRKVDISESDELFERYGLLIPVLLDERSQRELTWPFGREQLAEFLTPGEGA